MGRKNWNKLRDRARMHRRGVESFKGPDLRQSIPAQWSPSPQPPQPTKAQLRAEADAAVAAWRADVNKKEKQE